MKVVRHWKRLLREVVDAPSSEVVLVEAAEVLKYVMQVPFLLHTKKSSFLFLVWNGWVNNRSSTGLSVSLVVLEHALLF